MSKPSFVYVIYIASTAETVFEALTDAKISERYWSGNHVESDWKVGSTFALKLKREVRDITGEVIEVDPPRRLAYTFHPQHGGLENEKPSRVTFTLEQQKDQVKLTVMHDDFEPGSKVFEGISRGWPLVLSSLQSLMETGQVVLHAPWYEEEDAKRAAAEAAREQPERSNA
jgi:uncharacterized protein YndB with AHSA1/START domain